MNVGPDGSLCRITSSAKDLINNIKIIKDPDSQPFYKLVVLRLPDEQEELSEKSDEEISNDELSDIEFPSKDIEKETVVDKPVNKIDKQNDTISEEVTKERNHYNKYRQYNRNKRFFNRRNNNFNKIAKRCKGVANMEGVYNYGNRDFNSKSNRDFSCKPYNTDSYQHPFEDFTPSPWIEPPAMLSNPNYSGESFAVVPLPEKPRNSFGLLGDRPSYVPPKFQSNKQNDNYQNSTYTPMISNFQSNSKSDNFVCDQTSSYPSSNNINNGFVHNLTPNYSSAKQTDNFNCNQKYWNGGYGNYNKSNQLGNEYLNNTKKSWNKKSRRHQNARNNSSFDYRN